jgi:16S rRNA A1518/A1519 N6-dimethyltransferase RsmA/KsgA/DIM1 with predicted DNA glycosylase/AP lyase activity
VPVDDERSIQPNSELDQHFLSNPVKLVLFIEAAGIRSSDYVVEIGAGIGTVAERIPTCERLTVIEYDGNLISRLRQRIPHAQVIEGDALRILSTVRCDVLLSNLPSRLAPSLIGLLPSLHFRVAIVTVSSIDNLLSLEDAFMLDAVAVLEPHDFWPQQAGRATVVKITRA